MKFKSPFLRRGSMRTGRDSNPSRQACRDDIAAFYSSIIIFSTIFKIQKPLLKKRLFADRTGLEPATSAVTGRHSNQLNYRSSYQFLITDAKLTTFLIQCNILTKKIKKIFFTHLTSHHLIIFASTPELNHTTNYRFIQMANKTYYGISRF